MSANILVTQGGPLAEPPSPKAAFFCDIDGGPLVLFACTGRFGEYTFYNVGSNPLILQCAGAAIIGRVQSIILAPGASLALTDYAPQKWIKTMAFEPNAPTGTVPKVPITATVTLPMPGQDTRYPVNITANTIISLPASDGSGKKLFFDFDSLGTFVASFALNGTDTFVTPLPPIQTGATFALVSDAVGKWSIE